MTFEWQFRLVGMAAAAPVVFAFGLFVVKESALLRTERSAAAMSAPVAGKSPTVDDNSVMCVADVAPDPEAAPEPKFLKGQQIQIPDEVGDCLQSRKKHCHMEKGGTLTVMDDPDDLSTRKGMYQPTRTDRHPWVSDTENVGLNECPRGVIAFSEDILKSRLAQAELEARENEKLSRIFAK